MADVMKPDPKGLRGKVVLITGASSGIGKDCALRFAEEGSFLAITGRNKDALLKVKESCLSLGLADDEVLPIIAELDKEGGTDKLVKEAVEHFKRIDVLVNNAGTVIPGPIETIKMEEFDSMMNINLRVPFHLSKLCLPFLVESKGSIVNVSSIAGIRALPSIAMCSLARGATDQMTRCLSLEVAGRGVRVNSVNPGFVKTNIFKRAGFSDEQYAEMTEHFTKLFPLGRVGEPEDVSQAVVFLASSEASFITGATLVIDGGFNLVCPR